MGFPLKRLGPSGQRLMTPTVRQNARQKIGLPAQLYLVIAAGGALGTLARFILSGLVANGFGETFPWGTLIVNVSGSFVIGFFAALTGPDGRFFVSGTTRQFVMVGFCGGYTTFSSFSLQTLNLMRDGEWMNAAANVFGSVVLCLLFVWLGAMAATVLNRLQGG